VPNAEPLAQLKDIHLPTPISWWPLASGWYVLISLIVLAIVYFFHWSYQRKMNAKPKKQALELLTTYKEQYEKDGLAQIASARVSELLRRVALVYYPRAQVASLHGDSWIEFLNQTSKGIDFKPVQSMLLESPFKKGETINLKPLLTRAEQWIKQRGIPCSN
jgi:hypothetical protein